MIYHYLCPPPPPLFKWSSLPHLPIPLKFWTVSRAGRSRQGSLYPNTVRFGILCGFCIRFFFFFFVAFLSVLPTISRMWLCTEERKLELNRSISWSILHIGVVPLIGILHYIDPSLGLRNARDFVKGKT